MGGAQTCQREQRRWTPPEASWETEPGELGHAEEAAGSRPEGAPEQKRVARPRLGSALGRLWPGLEHALSGQRTGQRKGCGVALLELEAREEVC